LAEGVVLGGVSISAERSGGGHDLDAADLRGFERPGFGDERPRCEVAGGVLDVDFRLEMRGEELPEGNARAFFVYAFSRRSCSVAALAVGKVRRWRSPSASYQSAT